MGTSNSYGGPKQGSPLLPPWAPEIAPVDVPTDEIKEPGIGLNGETDSDNTPEIQEEQSDSPESPIYNRHSRAAAIRHIGGFVGSGNQQTLQRAIGSHVRSRGGSRGAALSATSGRTVTAKLGGFLSRAALEGAGPALSEIGLGHLVGESAQFALSQIVDMLSPEGTSLEDQVARDALLDTLIELTEEFALTENLDNLSALDEEGVENAILSSVTNYIYRRLLLESQEGLETHDANAAEITKKESEIKAYIRLQVRFSIQDALSVDWNGPQGRQIVFQLFDQAYAVWEAGS